jgi:hypothetical protein
VFSVQCSGLRTQDSGTLKPETCQPEAGPPRAKNLALAEVLQATPKCNRRRSAIQQNSWTRSRITRWLAESTPTIASCEKTTTARYVFSWSSLRGDLDVPAHVHQDSRSTTNQKMEPTLIQPQRTQGTQSLVGSDGHLAWGAHLCYRHPLPLPHYYGKIR